MNENCENTEYNSTSTVIYC